MVITGSEFDVMANVCAGEAPQLLFATTEMFPLGEPFAIVEMELFEPPPTATKPLGSVHW